VSASQKVTPNIVSWDLIKKVKEEKELLGQWRTYFSDKSHEDLLQNLVHQHENNFPLRRSQNLSDQIKHKALVDTLQERAQTQFLRTFLDEIRGRELN
jgi:hypothetical protein